MSRTFSSSLLHILLYNSSVYVYCESEIVVQRETLALYCRQWRRGAYSYCERIRHSPFLIAFRTTCVSSASLRLVRRLSSWWFLARFSSIYGAKVLSFFRFACMKKKIKENVDFNYCVYIIIFFSMKSLHGFTMLILKYF